MKIMAHRGSRATHPENTLPAFVEAIRVGADGIELDVHLSKDRHLIVIHDETFERTCGDPHQINELKLHEIKMLDAGKFKGNAFAGIRVPTLPEVLATLQNNQFAGLLNIELKTDRIHDPEIEEITHRLMTSQEWSFPYMYSSMKLQTLQTLFLLEPETPLGYIFGNSEIKFRKALKVPFLEAIHPRLDWCIAHQKRLATLPFPVRVWTIDDSDEFRFCMLNHLNTVMTDMPEEAIRWRKQYE